MNIQYNIILLFGLLLWFVIGSSEADKERRRLNTREKPTNKNESPVSLIQDLLNEDKVLKPSIKASASYRPLIWYGMGFTLSLGILISVIWGAFSIGGVEEIGFVKLVAIWALVITGPFMGVMVFSFWKQSRAFILGKTLLEFYSDGMVCHSKLLGPVGFLEWPDVVSFHPVVPRASRIMTVVVLFRNRNEMRRGIDEVYEARYAVNRIDLDIVKFLELLEGFTGLKAGRTQARLVGQSGSI